MPTILVHTAFNLLLSPMEKLRFETGGHPVSDAVANHWWTKKHADTIDPGLAPAPVAAEAEPAPEVTVEAETNVEPDEPAVVVDTIDPGQTDEGDAEDDAAPADLLDADGKDGMGGSIDRFDQMSDDALLEFLAEQDGRRPHPKTSRVKLLAAARSTSPADTDAGE